MEIKIDTSKDDVEHIKHMITFLQNFVNQTSNRTGYEVQNTENSSNAGVFDMFNSQETENGTHNTASTPAPSEGIFGLFGQDTTPSVQNTNSSSSANDILNDSVIIEKDKEEDMDNEQKIEIIPY